MSSADASEIITRILDSAEENFARHGYAGASFRSITKQAGVNLAAAHYHLGDKRLLYTMVLTRRLRPINELRLAALTEMERQTGNQPASLARILDILARPLFESAGEAGSPHFARLLGRTLTDPLPFSAELINMEFQPTTARFAQAIRRHLLNLPPEEFLWRLSFVIGAMHHSLATLHHMKGLTQGICRDHDHATALQGFVRFALAALTAPPTV